MSDHRGCYRTTDGEARNLYRAGLALNLERIQPLENSLTRCAPLRLLVTQDTGRKALASTARMRLTGRTKAKARTPKNRNPLPSTRNLLNVP